VPHASTLDLLEIDHLDPTLRGERFHDVLRDAAARGWLARTGVGFLVLERDLGIEILRDHRLAFPALQMLLLQGVSEGPIWERTVNGMMVKVGEPHLRLRRLVAPAMSPRSIGALRASVRASAEDRWRTVAARGRCEFVAEFAKPIPSSVIAHLLGLPGEADRFAHWSTMLQAVFKLGTGTARLDIERAYEEVRGYVLELLEERRQTPGEDFISAIATYRENGDRLSDDECVTVVIAVISGGIDTTQAQLGHGMRLFSEHPEQWELLARHPSLAVQAANEVLRFEPITPFTARIATRDVEYRDVTFPEGTLLFACAETANRDPATFERPNEFDVTVDRGRAPILTFGLGDHFCLGAQLARMELAETFALLASRMRNLRLDGDPVYGSILGIYAMESVPIAFDPA
jgi:cytochrome P450